MIDSTQTLGFIGCGTMGEAILKGVLRANVVPAQQVQVADAVAQTVARLKAVHAVAASTDSQAVASNSNVIVVAVKPHMMEPLLNTDGMRQALLGKVVISVAAGVRLSQLSAWLPGSQVVRAMPNTPALIGQGMTALCRSSGASDASMAAAQAIFSACGLAVEIDEKNMDAATAIAGSGPAFVYLLIEAAADGGVRMGLKRDVALKMAAQVFQGAAQMVVQTETHPAVLKDQVTTPGGCTIAGLLTLEDGGVRGVVARAVEEAAEVAGGLGQTPQKS